jgi:DNA-binding phage protein
MEAADRMVRIEREQGKSLVRAMHLTEIQAAGAARAAALHEADHQLDRVARALPAALSAGLTLAEIARSAGVSRQTLYELKGRYGSADDVELAVLQVLATRAPMTRDELATAVARDGAEVGRVVDELVDGRHVRWTGVEADEGEIDALQLTERGRQALRDWWGPPGAPDSDAR